MTLETLVPSVSDPSDPMLGSALGSMEHAVKTKPSFEAFVGNVIKALDDSSASGPVSKPYDSATGSSSTSR